MLKDIQKFRETFAASAKGNGSNAYLGVILGNDQIGLSYKNIGSGPCHGAFQSYQLREKINGLPIKYLLSTVQSHNYEKEQVVPYIDWMANRSPWAALHVEKDPEAILKFGWVISPDFPANLVASACIATRAFTEHYTPSVGSRFKTYLHILSLGFKEEEALLMSYLFVKGNTSRYSVVFAELVAGHGIFALNGQPECYYRNFLLGTPKNLVGGTFASNKGYDGEVCAVWKTPSVPASTAFMTWIKRVRPRDAVGKKNLNIFEKILTDGWEYTTEEGFKNVLEQILERILHAK